MPTITEAIAMRQAKLAKMQQVLDRMKEVQEDLNALLRAKEILDEAGDGDSGLSKAIPAIPGEPTLVDKIEALMEPGEKLHVDVILTRLRAHGTISSKNSIVNTLLRLAPREDRFRRAGPNIFERIGTNNTYSNEGVAADQPNGLALHG